VKCAKLKSDILAKEQNNEVIIRESELLQESFVEQELVIGSLRQQLRDSEDVVSLYVESNARSDVVFASMDDNEDEGRKPLVFGVVDEVNENNISFELEQASTAGKFFSQFELNIYNSCRIEYSLLFDSSVK